MSLNHATNVLNRFILDVLNCSTLTLEETSVDCIMGEVRSRVSSKRIKPLIDRLNRMGIDPKYHLKTIVEAQEISAEKLRCMIAYQTATIFKSRLVHFESRFIRGEAQ